MIIGRMDKRVILRRPIKADDGQGGKIKTDDPQGITVWAEFRKPSLQVVAVNGDVVSVMTREISIRYRPDVSRGWKLEYKNKVFEILGTYQPDKETTIMICKDVTR